MRTPSPENSAPACSVCAKLWYAGSGDFCDRFRKNAVSAKRATGSQVRVERKDEGARKDARQAMEKTLSISKERRFCFRVCATRERRAQNGETCRNKVIRKSRCVEAKA